MKYEKVLPKFLKNNLEIINFMRFESDELKNRYTGLIVLKNKRIKEDQ